MLRLFEVTVSLTTYPATAQIDFLAAAPAALPKKLKVMNTGGIPVYVSYDGTNNHDYLMSGEVTVYRDILEGNPKLWFKLESAGSTTVKIVEY